MIKLIHSESQNLHAPFTHKTQHVCHVSTPHVSTPHVSTPHVSTPHVSTPHVSIPHVSIPHGSIPHGSILHVSTPHGSIPHVSTPHGKIVTFLRKIFATFNSTCFNSTEEFFATDRGIAHYHPC
jgi:hypothetical protein